MDRPVDFSTGLSNLVLRRESPGTQRSQSYLLKIVAPS